ncbi:FYVE and coiled-coil domain-containing protein 1 isoform X2 [Ambystoma mexicanum]|uniref:FYVE and coiled-coil domain-containing protein 1 isoform X2 n=1 Tax=Ambystoma mexicanum TaxID=8296 RepID=UPI0037E7629C
MMATTAEGSQLQRIIRDLQDAVTELSREFTESGEPVTDDSSELRRFFYKVEYLLQFDQKEKLSLLGNRKDYWDYFCDCLAKEKGANDGIRFVKSISELKTSLGKGRAFLRYSLVHQRLADTLQQCFMNVKVTSDWYYARSPFLKPKVSSEIVSCLYELTEVQFDLASRGYDLDATWPNFSRKTLASPGSSTFLWKPPSRCSSVSSLVGGYIQAQDFPASLEFNNSLGNETSEGLDEMRIELDHSELRQKELQDRLQQLEMENVELHRATELQKAQAQLDKEKLSKLIEENGCLTTVTEELRKQCEVSNSSQLTLKELQESLKVLELNASEKEKEYKAQIELLESGNKGHVSQLQLVTEELEANISSASMKALQIEELQLRINTTEQKNLELLARIDSIVTEKNQQSVMESESALKIEELLEKLRDRERDEALKQGSDHPPQLECITKEFKQMLGTQGDLDVMGHGYPPSSMENVLLESGPCPMEASMPVSEFAVPENTQVAVNVEDLSTIQSEALDHSDDLQQVTQDTVGATGKCNITEALLIEKKLQIEGLQDQIKVLNMSHVKDLLLFRESEDALKKDLEKAAHQRADLERNLLCLKDELQHAKTYAHTLEMENVEAKEVLDRTNTEMAELGIQICSLSSEKGDAERKLAQALEQLEELGKQAPKEREQLQLELAEFREANKGLGEKLKELEKSATAIPDLQKQLNETQKQASSIQEVSKEEISTVKFQMSAEILKYENKLKASVAENEEIIQELEEEKQNRLAAEKEMADLQALRDVLQKQLDDATEKLRKAENESLALKERLARTESQLEKANNQVTEYSERFTKTSMEKESNEQIFQANLDDLTRTKEFLEERLVELIRDKDVLWQKSDALEYEQKLRAEERWLVDTEVAQCLNCSKNFSWMVRRHHCRLCGGIFCYYCCNNYKMTKHSGKRERCCDACFSAPSVVVFSDDSEGSNSQESPSPTEHAATSETRKVTDEDAKPLDDVVFDIITDEELSQVQECDSPLAETQSDVFSLDHSAAEVYSSCSSLTLDEADDLQIPQDIELHLLKTGDMMVRLPLTLEEISSFGESSRELFIKSSTYSIIPINVTEIGLTISWVFSTDTKSIAFSVVYQEEAESQLDQYKVLIPMTRCNAHMETIRGQLKARNCGIYTLIFDNSFSRFISKKVFYHLSIERPVVYDGSDFP